MIKVETANLRILFLAMVASKVEGLVANADNSHLNCRCSSAFLKMISERPNHEKIKSNLQILEKLQAALERVGELLRDDGCVCQAQLQAMSVLSVLLVNFLDDRKLEVVRLQREINKRDQAKRAFPTFPTDRVPLRRVAVPAKATAEMRPKMSSWGKK